jgi:hypothetical protein
MQIPVLIEPVATSGFRARSGEPLPLTVEGVTREEALNKLKQLLESKLQNGSELVTLQIGSAENPWLRGAGIFANSPLFDEWKAIMEENRRKADEEEAIQ